MFAARKVGRAGPSIPDAMYLMVKTNFGKKKGEGGRKYFELLKQTDTILYMESYNSIFCKCIKDKPTNTKSVAKLGYRIFLSCSCHFFRKGNFHIGGWGCG